VDANQTTTFGVRGEFTRFFPARQQESDFGPKPLAQRAFSSGLLARLDDELQAPLARFARRIPDVFAVP